MLIKDYQSTIKLFQSLQIKDIFFAVTFPKDAIGIENILPLKIVCIDNHPLINDLRKNNDVFSLTENCTDSNKRNTSSLLRNRKTQDWINSHSQQPKILVFKPSPSLEKICQKQKWSLLANPAKTNRFFENKIIFSRQLAKLSLPQPEFNIQNFHQLDYPKIKKKFGPEFFIQFARGFAGSSTFLIENQSQLTQLQKKYPNKPCKISRKISGPTYSLNCCLTKNNGLVIQKPFYQITALPQLNRSPGGTCGNIYSDKLKNIKNLSQLYDDIEIFSQLLIQKKYRGIFGLDFVIDEKTGQYFFIECNPRLTASIPMISKLQIKNKEIPLLAIHILEMLDIDYQIDYKARKKIEENPSIGSQIIFRNINDQPSIPTIFLSSGIYISKQKFSNILKLKEILLKTPQSFIYKRPGTNISKLKNKQEFLIYSEPKNKIISPDIEYLRVQALI